MDIETIRFLYSYGKCNYTVHVQLRLRERGISYEDVESVICTGRIIEADDNALPFPKSLILGGSVQGRPLHVLVSVGRDSLNIVTAYYPAKDKWKNNFSERRGGR